MSSEFDNLVRQMNLLISEKRNIVNEFESKKEHDSSKIN